VKELVLRGTMRGMFETDGLGLGRVSSGMLFEATPYGHSLQSLHDRNADHEFRDACSECICKKTSFCVVCVSRVDKSKGVSNGGESAVTFYAWRKYVACNQFD
jgi:hypothetical protein